jgi:hypothetical protein
MFVIDSAKILTAWGENTAILALSAITCAFRLPAVRIIKSLTNFKEQVSTQDLNSPFCI